MTIYSLHIKGSEATAREAFAKHIGSEEARGVLKHEMQRFGDGHYYWRTFDPDAVELLNRWYTEEASTAANDETPYPPGALLFWTDVQPEPTRQGFRRGVDYDSYSYAFVVYDRADVEKYAQLNSWSVEDTALDLAGFCAHDGGPGRAFRHEPWVRITRSRIVVRQTSGLDV